MITANRGRATLGGRKSGGSARQIWDLLSAKWRITTELESNSATRKKIETFRKVKHLWARTCRGKSARHRIGIQFGGLNPNEYPSKPESCQHERLRAAVRGGATPQPIALQLAVPSERHRKEAVARSTQGMTASGGNTPHAPFLRFHRAPLPFPVTSTIPSWRRKSKSCFSWLPFPFTDSLVPISLSGNALSVPENSPTISFCASERRTPRRSTSVSFPFRNRTVTHIPSSVISSSGRPA